MKNSALQAAVLLTLVSLPGCDSGPAPAGPTAPQSFLTGTWQGTVTVQLNSDGTPPPPVTSGTTTWRFVVVPQTNLQTFQATIHLEDPWLPVDTSGTTTLTPTNTPPAHISTQGDYPSPRGCRGTFGSFGTATSTQIDADFTGVDCNLVTFTGHVALTKQ
jgi:hypothetical protein